MIKFLDENSPELKARMKAIRSLIDHIDDSMMGERMKMKSMKMKSMGDGMMMEEESEPMEKMEMIEVASDQEPMMMKMNDHDADNSTMDDDMGMMTPGDEIHDVTQMEDNPMMDAENPETAMSMSNMMKEMMEEGAKYRPRVKDESKGRMYIVNKKASMEAPPPARMMRGMKKK